MSLKLQQLTFQTSAPLITLWRFLLQRLCGASHELPWPFYREVTLHDAVICTCGEPTSVLCHAGFRRLGASMGKWDQTIYLFHFLPLWRGIHSVSSRLGLLVKRSPELVRSLQFWLPGDPGGMPCHRGGSLSLWLLGTAFLPWTFPTFNA